MNYYQLFEVEALDKTPLRADALIEAETIKSAIWQAKRYIPKNPDRVIKLLTVNAIAGRRTLCAFKLPGKPLR